MARTFLTKNTTVSNRKSQNRNPVRAQNLIKFFVEDLFAKLKQVFEHNNNFENHERI